MGAIGYIPEDWRKDLISFLYKRKGDRLVAKNYRPITIAPSLGKHYEGILLYMMNLTPDLNEDNHAYTSNKSCLTAIINLQENLKQARTENVKVQKEGYRVVTIIMAEDISSAFESVLHCLIIQFINHNFKVGNMNLGASLACYLDREAFTLDRTTDEKLPVRKRYSDRSTPQGSLVSPKIWRIYDNIFSHIYKNALQQLKDKTDWIVDFFHCSYADDHVTLASLLLPIDADKDEVQAKMSELVLLCRQLLDNATTTVGCGINRDKSEVVTTKNWNLPEVKSKQEFKWLGYTLELTTQHYLKFTETNMIGKFYEAKRNLENIYQYLSDEYTKLQIWKIYIAPIIEWFLPCIAHKKRHELAQNNKIESFQLQTLCLALRASTKIGTTKINEVACIRPVKLRLLTMGSRLAKHVPRAAAELMTTQPNQVNSAYGLRSGMQQRHCVWTNAEFKNFTDQIIILKEEFKNTDERLLGRFQRDSRHRVKFNKHEIRSTISSLNSQVRSHIQN